MLGPYRSALRDLLLQAKFHADNAALRALGLLLAVPAGTLPPAHVLIPMPLHPARLRQRGFNQCLELARPLAATLGIPLRPDLLIRSIDTAHQRGLTAEARRRNLRGAFVAGPVRAFRELNNLNELRVLLLDDVATTGTTLRQAATVLVAAGAIVDVIVVGRA